MWQHVVGRFERKRREIKEICDDIWPQEVPAKDPIVNLRIVLFDLQIIAGAEKAAKIELIVDEQNASTNSERDDEREELSPGWAACGTPGTQIIPDIA